MKHNDIVHCHECVSLWVNPDNGRMWCKAPMGAFGHAMVDPDGFCSRGERMSDYKKRIAEEIKNAARGGKK